MSPINFFPLTETLAVSGQISPAALQAIAAAGFKSVVCNRPDTEAPDHFTSQELSEIAMRVGVKMAYMPVVSDRLTVQDGHEFKELLEQLPTPVLAYCQSGLRSVTLWALSQAHRQAWPDLVQRAAKAGFSLNDLPPGNGSYPIQTVEQESQRCTRQNNSQTRGSVLRTTPFQVA